MKHPSTPHASPLRARPALIALSRTTCLCVAASALTVACGGGGTPSLAPALTLEKANMVAVAHKANDGFVLFELAGSAADYALWGGGWFTSGKPYACEPDDPLSGTVTFTTNRAEGGFEPGDFLSIQYDNCQLDSEGTERTNGSLVMKLLAISGDPQSLAINQPWSYQVTVQYKGFSVLSAGGRVGIDGDLQVTKSSPGPYNTALDERITTHFETTSVRLTEDADVHEYTQASGTLVSHFSPENTWVATLRTELHSSRFQGRIGFTTQTPFEGALGNMLPQLGSGRITGAEEQWIDLVAQPAGVQGNLRTPESQDGFFIDWSVF